MKKILLQLIIPFFIFQATGAQQKITIDINVQYQTMHGFGASDAWNIDYVGKYWSEAVKEDMAEKLFSKDTDSQGNPLGIGLSRWRFNIGAGSSEQGAASNIDTLYADFITTVLKHFSDSGMTFAQVSPVNEPQYEWNSGNPKYLGDYMQMLPGICGHSYWTDGDDYADLTNGGTIDVDKNLWVLVYINWSAEEKTVTHVLSNPSPAYSFISMTPYLTGSGYNLSRRNDISGGGNYTLPPRSVVTLVASLDAGNLTNVKNTRYDNNESFNIYPNPTTGVFTITSEGSAFKDNSSFQLFDATGRLIYSNSLKTDHLTCHALQKNQSGLYFIKIGTQTGHIIKF